MTTTLQASRRWAIPARRVPFGISSSLELVGSCDPTSFGEAVVIPLTRGYFTVVDVGDVSVVRKYKWRALTSPSGLTYAYTKIRRKAVALHNFLLIPEVGFEVDHADRNGLNNRRHNLRLATRSQNMANRGIQKNNTSGYRGVHFNRRSGRWIAQVKINGDRVHLGCFPTAEAAARAFDASAAQLYGSFANLNFSLPAAGGTHAAGTPITLDRVTPGEDASFACRSGLNPFDPGATVGSTHPFPAPGSEPSSVSRGNRALAARLDAISPSSDHNHTSGQGS